MRELFIPLLRMVLKIMQRARAMLPATDCYLVCEIYPQEAFDLWTIETRQQLIEK